MGIFSDWLTDVGQSFFGNPSQAWDRFKNGRTNEINEGIANENLAYQKERNKIEDARYEDETAYNRAFAEDQRAYERALQQQIFEREDTAIERQADSLSKLGINPLSQQLNGLGAGTPVTPGAAAVSSSRGGSALHNDFVMQDKGIMESIAPIMSFANSVSNLNTQGFQRDKLREEADYQRLLNQEQKIQNERLAVKLDTEQAQRDEDLRHSKANNPNIEKDKKASAERNQRENVFQNEFGVTDNTPKEIRWATDTAKQAERASNYVSDKVGDLSRSAMSALAFRASKAIDSYNKVTKKADNWIYDKYNKVKGWFKSHTASSDELRSYYK